MQVVSFFSGIGGFELAAEWMGWDNISSCEINPFGQQVLKHYWPNSLHHADIKTIDYEKIKNRINRQIPTIIVGGFPCQPYSLAGKRAGKADDRHLWPYCIEAVKQLQPDWCVFENVFGLINWSDGLVFHEVQTDLEAAGYEVWPYVLPACAVNAPHRRDRVWFIANKSGKGLEGRRQVDGWEKHEGKWADIRDNNPTNGNERITTHTYGNGYDAKPTERDNFKRQNNQQTGSQWQRTVEGFSNERYATNASDEGLQGSKVNGGIRGIWQNGDKQLTRCFPSNWQNFPTVSPVRYGNDGISDRLFRYITKDLIDAISKTSKENRIENLLEVQNRISQKKIWEQIRGLYSLESKNILLKTMQLYSTESHQQNFLSPFSEKVSEPILQHLSKHTEFRSSPQGQELAKQRTEQFANTLSFLPHEVALAARRFEIQLAKFQSWHRNESIKAGGNAIVPQVAYQIFKAIQEYENTNNQLK